MTEKEKNDGFFYYGYAQKEGEKPTHLIKAHSSSYIEEVTDSIHNTLVTIPIKDFIPISNALKKSKFLYCSDEERYEDISQLYDEEIKSIISSLYKEITNDKH